MRLRTTVTVTGLALVATAFVAPASVASAAAASGEAGADPSPVVARASVGGWSKLSTAEARITSPVAMHRSPDGNLHTLHAQKFPSGNHAYVHSLLSPEGSVVRQTPLPMDDSGLGAQPTLQATPTGGLRVVFTSLDPSSDLRRGRLAQATSEDSGATWTIREEALSRDSTTWSDSGLDATYLPDGTTVQAWSHLSGITWRTGTITGRVSDALADQVAGPGGYRVALNRVGDSVLAAWQSHDGGTTPDPAIRVRQIWPTVGAAVTAPDSAQGWATSRVPFVSRAADGTSWVAYNTRARTGLAVWRPGTAKPVKVARKTHSSEYDLAAAPDGRLWASWTGGAGTFVAHTGPKGTGFSAPRRIKAPAGVSTVYKIQVDAAAGGADLAIVTEDGVHHTRVLPALTAKAKPGRLGARRAKKVTFTVTDGSDRLAGALVRAGGKKCLTSSKGVCKIKLSPRRAGKVKARITRTGFAAASVTLKVKG
ncbi:hypothetical protein [Nocardioides sp. 616]|uniref:hypothetical protein n=1 Tax=Nocardioides sp. 616 TaxID=2268090 RepID=UPI000CE430B5|nr:hypothetical protein [Nocardioides sp. 616]